MNPPASGPGFALVIGLDRADQKVDLCQLDGTSAAPRCSTVSTAPEALRACFEEIRARYPEGRIGLCLEAPAGNLLAFFASHTPWLEVYPVNPLTLKRFRETFILSRANDDGKDALYLARLLQKHAEELRRWAPEDPPTARLQQLVVHRRAVIDERTALTNRLQALLKGYFPQALELCGDDLWRPLALAFLRRWPNLQALRKARPETLRSFYYVHGSRSQKTIEHRLAVLQQSVALTEEPAVIECFSLRVSLVVRQLAALLPVIAQYERQIAECFAQHPDGPVFASLPGAGKVLAPRLLAAVGTQRERFPTAAALQAATAIAPVTRQSGGKRLVRRRVKGALFLRQSFHESSGTTKTARQRSPNAAARARHQHAGSRAEGTKARQAARKRRAKPAPARGSRCAKACAIAHGRKPTTSSSAPKAARIIPPSARSPTNGSASSGAAGKSALPTVNKPIKPPCSAPAARSPLNSYPLPLTAKTNCE